MTVRFIQLSQLFFKQIEESGLAIFVISAQKWYN